MTRYRNVKVNIWEWQKEKLQHAIKAGCPAVSIRLGHEDLEGNDSLAVTDLQVKKLAKALENGKGIMIRMSSKQLKHNKKIEGGFLSLFSQISHYNSENRFTDVRCWRSFRVSLIRGTKSNGVGSLPQERWMRLSSGNGWIRIILKTVQG